MKYLIPILFIFLIPLTVFSQSMESLRSNYTKAVANKDLCATIIKELEHNNATPKLRAYLGAYQTIWANHAGNPVNKLATFNKGKNNIEYAILKSPNDIEIRFLRYSVQKEAPHFLGYSNHLAEDEAYLRTHIAEIDAPTLKALVERILQNK